MTTDHPPLQADPGAQGMTLGDQTYDVIFRRIIEGDFPENTRLPSEGELADLFGISRPVLRQALSRLKSDGLVVSRRGSGNYVLRRPDPAMLRFVSAADASDIQRCFEYRFALEGETAKLAAQRRSAEHLTAIEKALLMHRSATQMNQTNVDSDYDFHLAVARASLNRYFVETITSLKPSIVSGMQLHRHLALELAKERMSITSAEHENILRAIRDQSPARARNAMRSHLANARQRILGRASQSLRRPPENREKG